MWDSCVNKQLLLETWSSYHSSPVHVLGILVLKINKYLWIEKTFLSGFFFLEI